MTSKQMTALALVAAAIAMLSFCTLTKRWFQVDYWGSKFSIGLLSMEGCAADTCKSESLADTFNDDDDKTYVRASQATFGLGLLSVALLLTLIPLGIKHHEKVATMGKIALGVLILTIFAALVVMLKKPTVANPSLGVFLFMIGGMSGVIGAQMLSVPGTYEHITRDPSIPRL
jgi:hypothetical protein